MKEVLKEFCKDTSTLRLFIASTAFGSRLIKEEAACARPANTTTGMLFTTSNAVKFPSAVTRSSWALPLSYYRTNTFLPYRISKPIR